MSRPVYSIRFPMVRERTGYRRGPRFRRVPDPSSLSGARGCACRMVRVAMMDRDSAARATDPEHARWHRATMRANALWARLFAGQIAEDDPRMEAARAACAEFRRRFAARMERAA